MKQHGFIVAVGVGAFACAAANGQAGWPQVFDPMQVLNLHLEMAATDWQTIQDDETFSVEVPAQFRADGEAPLLVSVRRKSATPLQNGTPFKKVSLKIDINEYVAGQSWWGLNKLSLENGDDQDVVTEGIGWHLHRAASGSEGYGYQHPAALSAWVTLSINGVPTGVYLSVEQRDKRMLENRGLHVGGLTWLYEVEDIAQLQIEVGTGASPTLTQLCYTPFEPWQGAACAAPTQAVMAAQMDELISMHGMLTLAAVEKFSRNSDGMFSHAKNFFFADFHPTLGRKRMYFPWDLDSSMGGAGGPNAGTIYTNQSAYGQILNIPQFRAQYSQIMNNLLCGPLQQANLHAFLSAVEPVLTPHLAADPNNRIGSDIAGFFSGRRSWLSERIETVRGQIENYVPCGNPCYPNCDGSTAAPILNVADFGCFLQKFAAGDGYANCDGSTVPPVLNVADFGCFLTQFAAGCR